MGPEKHFKNSQILQISNFPKIPKNFKKISSVLNGDSGPTGDALNCSLSYSDVTTNRSQPGDVTSRPPVAPSDGGWWY